ncbi:radical SAM protein [Aceticella autotrophica]|uniref:Radical SAM protein n=1 Tax=Aceticella autotrophica TaxID=2755338 RepID=A0A975AWJ5_9THEO|nr:radical SAM protein [Aceticella autotrophica]QSZ27796.1 radical SAM protein [Aceticella autotrophica]
MTTFEKCNICPHNCNINRKLSKGFCQMSDKIKLAKAYLHKWEEPCISGNNGSGTVFFSGCNLKCVFCQNFKISQENFGKEVTSEELSEIFLNLQKKGAHNINLVSPTIYLPAIKNNIIISKNSGLTIPIVYNSNAYENVSALRALSGLIDIYLPDLKYFEDAVSIKYSKAPGYFKYASKAVLEMFRQVGIPRFDEKGILKRGLIIRHLILPGKIDETKKILKWIKENLPEEIYISLMGQYTPYYKACDFPEINKKISHNEYEDVINYFFDIGLKNGYVQEANCASDKFIPDFDLEGI